MRDYADLKRWAALALIAGEIPESSAEQIERLIAENNSLKGSCKAMGSKNVDKTLRENKRLKELVEKFQESAKITAEATDAANIFGENMERAKNRLKADNEVLRKALRPLLDHWDDLKPGESINVDAARAAMSKEP